MARTKQTDMRHCSLDTCVETLFNMLAIQYDVYCAFKTAVPDTKWLQKLEFRSAGAFVVCPRALKSFALRIL